MPKVSDINIKFLMGLKPEDAIAYLEKKGFTFSWNWRDTWQDAHNRSFTVAKVMKMDILQTIRNEMQNVQSEGISYKDFLKTLEPKLKNLGWWGKVRADQVPGFDPNSGGDPSKEVQLGSPRRLKTIYDTNISTSLMAGRYKQQLDNAIARPFWKYIQIHRPSFRRSHHPPDGKVFMYNDPIWKIIYPPNGFGCGCTVRSLSKADMEAEGLKVSKGSDLKFTPDEGWSYNPGIETFPVDLNNYDKNISANFNE